MRVLHLLASWKWTGPAEPALETAALLARRPGLEVTLAFSSLAGRDQANQVEREAAALGLATRAGLSLDKHLHLPRLLGDARRLSVWLRRGEIDLIHCHLRGDHQVAALARALAGTRTPLVRSWYDQVGPGRSWRDRMLARGAEGAVVCGQRARDRVATLSGEACRIEVLLPPLDLERFRPGGPDLREAYCFRPEHFVAGVVARMQPHRRWDLLLAGFAAALARRPELRLLVVGRGPDWERLLLDPARAAGIDDRVVLAGYRRGADYVATLLAMDVLVFLVPGSDGTCRALRQAQAAGVPAVASHRGLLPELVREGETGLLVQEDPASLAAALERLAADREACRALGRGARRQAEARYHPERFAARVEALYRDLVPEGGRCAG